MRLRRLMIAGVAGFAVCLLAGNGRSAGTFDWPQFRGPDRNGISKETAWNPKALAAGPKILWRTNVGKGWSSFCIFGDRIFTIGNRNEQDTVVALNVKDGKEIWQHTYPCKSGDYPGPRSTPSTDGKVVYTLARDGQLFCLNFQDGKVIWQKSVLSEFKLENTTWNLAGSPVIRGDMLLLNAGEHGVALNRRTGEKIWVSGPGPGGYSTPVVYMNGATECLAIFGCKGVYGVELKTGKKLWFHSWETQYDVNAADPIVQNGKVFISSGYGRGCALIDVKGAEPKVVWEHKGMRNHFSSCTLLNGDIYGVDGNAGNGSLKCLDFATGKEKWSKNLGFGGMMIAVDKIIMFNENGNLFVVKASPSSFEEIASATKILGKTCWTAPVLCRGVIYCRNSEGDVAAVDVSK